MIIDGYVFRDEEHPKWCFCEPCQAKDPNKRDFAEAFENTFGRLPVDETDEMIEEEWDSYAEKRNRFYSWDQSDGVRAGND